MRLALIEELVITRSLYTQREILFILEQILGVLKGICVP